MIMPRVAPLFRLSKSEQIELIKLSRSAEHAGNVAFRATIILQAAAGDQNKDIARRLCCKPHIIKIWRDRWNEDGIEGLEDRPRSGRPKELTPQMTQKIVTRACQKPPKHLSRWSVRSLADAVRIDYGMVHRVLREYDLCFHRLSTFTFSPDPEFEDKLLEVVGLYMKPPKNAIILCVDEKPGIQALDRTQPMLPLKAKKPRAWTNEYVRHGTRTLLACLNVQTGEIVAEVTKRRTSKDFLSFMNTVVKQFPKRRLCVVLDNLNTHKNQSAKDWLEEHPQVTFHYTPTHASWVNLIECFFSILTRKGLQQKAFRSVKELDKFLNLFIHEYNVHCGPFEWTAGPKKLKKIIQLTADYQAANNS